jgi:hypothetical protein
MVFRYGSQNFGTADRKMVTMRFFTIFYPMHSTKDVHFRRETVKRKKEKEMSMLILVFFSK